MLIELDFRSKFTFCHCRSQGRFCGPIHARCNPVDVFRIHAL